MIDEEININLYSSSEARCVADFDENIQWAQEGIRVAGGKRWGTDLGSFNFPAGIWVDDDETIYVTDFSNHRLMKWKKDAKEGVVFAGDGQKNDRTERLRNPVDLIYEKSTDSFIIADQGNRRVIRWPRQLDRNVEVLVSNIDPWGIALDDYGYLYVCDHKRHEVKRWKLGEPIGTVVAGGNGKGARIHQLSLPTYIVVDKDQSIYVSDWANHRIVKWVRDARKGLLIAGGQEQRNFPIPLADPFGLYVDLSGNVFIADWAKHRLVRYAPGEKHAKMVVGEGGRGNAPNQLIHPMSFTFDRQGNLYVTDYSNHRIQKYPILTNQIKENGIAHQNGDEE